LKNNSQLQLIIVTSVKTDLPKGVVGDIMNYSHEHIWQNLSLIYNTAPNRVAVYALLRQDNKIVYPIYVHSKICIIDNVITIVGSANMDALSFLRSSELCVSIHNEEFTNLTLKRLASEHLEIDQIDDFSNQFDLIFANFQKVANSNSNHLRLGESLVGRVVTLMPEENYYFIRKLCHFPHRITKALFLLSKL